MEEAILQLEHVCKFYGPTPVIHEASLYARPGESVALVGPNGAGKTTLLHLCAGILPPSAGRLRVLGYSWGGAEAASPLPVQLWRMRKCIGFIPASHDLVERLTAREFLRFISALYDLPRSESEARIDRWVDFFSLSAAVDRPLGTYSHGMKRKVQIAGALIPRPKLLICDEATSGLDPEMVSLFRGLFRILTDQGVAILFASHDLSFAEKAAQRFYFVHEGRIIGGGHLDDLKTLYAAADLEGAFLRATGSGLHEGDLRAVVAG